MQVRDDISLPIVPFTAELILVSILLILPLTTVVFFAWWHSDIFQAWRESKVILFLWVLWGWLQGLYCIYIRRIADWFIVLFLFKANPRKKQHSKRA